MADYTLDVAMTVDLGDFDTKFARAAARIRTFGVDVAEADNRIGRMVRGTAATGRSLAAMTDEVGRAASKHESAFRDAGQAFTVFGATAAAGLGFAAKAAIDWESAWAGVVKTTDATGDALATLETDLRALTTVLPASHAEIAGVAEAAGQLGVASGDVVGFTKTMIDLGESTNLTSDQAATGIAQISNVMGTMAREGVGGVERFGAALVALGNAGASTEADILNMAQRLSGAGALVGASESDILALANAMASMGVQAELGGGVMSRVMLRVYTAVQNGGAALDQFASVAGTSAETFAADFEGDPIRAIDSFIRGLSRIDDSGGNVVATLRDIGFTGTYDSQVLLQLKGAGDLLTDSLDLGNQAWADNTALVDEANKRYETTASRIAIARNQLTELGIELGSVLLPALADLADDTAGVLAFFAGLPAPLKEAAVLLGAAAAAVGLLGGGLLLLAPRIVATRAALATLRAELPLLTGALKATTAAAAAAQSALLLLGVAWLASDLSGYIGRAQVADTTTKELADSLTGLGPKADIAGTALAGLFENNWSLFGDEVSTMTEAVDRFASSAREAAGTKFWDRIDRMLDMGTEAARFKEQTKGLDDAWTELVKRGNVEEAQRQFEQFTDAAVEQGVPMEVLQKEFAGYLRAAEAVKPTTEEATTAADVLTRAMEDQAAAAGMTAEQWEAAAKEVQAARDAWDEAARSFIDINGTYTAMLDERIAKEAEAAGWTDERQAKDAAGWETFVGTVRVAMDEYLAQLQRQVDAQTNWQSNMLGLVGKVSQGTLDYLARLGPEGAPLVQALVDGTDQQLQEFDRLTNLTMAGATDGWILTMEQTGPLLQAVAGRLGQETADKLAQQIRNGETTVAEAAALLGATIEENVPGEYTITFDANTSAVYTKITAMQAAIRAATNDAQFRIATGQGGAGGATFHDGGIALAMAGGGTLTPMAPVAQVVPPNTWRVVGDRLDVPESYIPHDGSPRSRSIFEQTARMLGYHLLPRSADVRHFAAGQVVGPTAGGSWTGTATLDPATVVAAFRGVAMTLLVDGHPVKAIVQTELKSEARAIASGR